MFTQLRKTLVACLLILLVGASCSKSNDDIPFTYANLIGFYEVVYEAHENVKPDGSIEVVTACNAGDVIEVSGEYFTWRLGGTCTSKEYGVNWFYIAGKDWVYIFNTMLKVDFWDGYSLKLSSKAEDEQVRYILELKRR